ncbi:TPA: hypothetical protein BOS_6990 [Bos taurus]|nr:TPA: hypothetical protein BOS_6990 [Bos taurus]
MDKPFPGHRGYGEEQALGAQRGNTAPPSGGGGSGARGGVLLATETEPRQGGPPRPAGGFKNGPPDDTSCSEPTAAVKKLALEDPGSNPDSRNFFASSPRDLGRRSPWTSRSLGCKNFAKRYLRCGAAGLLVVLTPSLPPRVAALS